MIARACAGEGLAHGLNFLWTTLRRGGILRSTFTTLACAVGCEPALASSAAKLVAAAGTSGTATAAAAMAIPLLIRFLNLRVDFAGGPAARRRGRTDDPCAEASRRLGRPRARRVRRRRCAVTNLSRDPRETCAPRHTATELALGSRGGDGGLLSRGRVRADEQLRR